MVTWLDFYQKPEWKEMAILSHMIYMHNPEDRIDESNQLADKIVQEGLRTPKSLGIGHMKQKGIDLGRIDTRLKRDLVYAQLPKKNNLKSLKKIINSKKPYNVVLLYTNHQEYVYDYKQDTQFFANPLSDDRRSAQIKYFQSQKKPLWEYTEYIHQGPIPAKKLLAFSKLLPMTSEEEIIPAEREIISEYIEDQLGDLLFFPQDQDLNVDFFDNSKKDKKCALRIVFEKESAQKPENQIRIQDFFEKYESQDICELYSDAVDWQAEQQSKEQQEIDQFRQAMFEEEDNFSSLSALKAGSESGTESGYGSSDSEEEKSWVDKTKPKDNKPPKGLSL